MTTATVRHPTPSPSRAPRAVRRAAVERSQLALLIGPEAPGLLDAALRTQGARLVEATVHQVHHRPGVGVTVGYAVRWRATDAPDGDPATHEYLLASTAPAAVGPHTVTLRVDLHEVRVWRHPVDPALPALAVACAPDEVARLLAVDPAALTLDLVTYRPLRRAVVRARTPGSTTYLKVVRPHTGPALHRRHELLAAAGLPVAGTTVLADGLLVLSEVAGTPLTEALAADGGARVDPAEVVAMLDRMPDAALDLSARASWADRVLDHAAAAAAAVPDRAGEIADLAHRLAAVIGSTDPGPLVPTHGDLHDANLLMAHDRLVGVLDVDQLGPGRRVDDLACLLAHLSVLPSLAPDVHRHVGAALPRWVAALEDGVDPVGLRARAAAVVLSLVAGAVSDDDAAGRLAVAHRWHDEAVDLRDLSSRRPAGLIPAHESRGVPGPAPAAHTARRGTPRTGPVPSRQQGEPS